MIGSPTNFSDHAAGSLIIACGTEHAQLYRVGVFQR